MGQLPGVAGAEGLIRTRFSIQRSGFHKRKKLGPPLAALAVGAVVFGVLAGFSASARASDAQARGDPVAALRNYVRVVAAAQPRAIKLAEAGSLMEWLQQGGPAAPAEGAKAPPPPPPKARTGKAPVIAATYVGSKVCLGCHAAVDATFGYTPMGRLVKQGKMQCETCHGPGSAHVKAGGGRGVGGIISFRTNDLSRTAEENNAICLGCHERGDRTYWQGSVHEERGLQCSNCHTIMRAVSAKYQVKTAFISDTCFQCHKDRKAQIFRSAHMPLREGKVVCTDCHNPHGSATEPLLRADSINDLCYKCHAEKRGPFLFEHEPVRENCDNCHDPHGSINEYSLKISRPRLCFECHGFGHGQANGVNAIFTMARSCQNCHTAIHGSNSPAGAALQR
jgi:DmsE family decaheme c-type cytochrome